MSVDHKPSLDYARIRELGGYVVGNDPGRVNGLLAVGRSLGDFYLHPYVSDKPHVWSCKLDQAPAYLILACDGVWDELEDQEAVVMVDSMISKGKLTEACRLLRDTAYAYGSDDNISVMIIHKVV